MKSIATLLSYIFHPLLLPTYLFGLIGLLFPAALFPVTDRSFKGIMILIFSTTFVLPAINMYFFRAFGAIQSMHMANRRERVAPFLMIALLYVLITYMLNTKTGIGWNDPFMKFLLLVDALVLFAFGITLFVKASIHALCAAAMVVIVAFLNQLVENGIFFYPMLLTLLLAGGVMSARLYLGAHTLRQVAIGAGVGVAVSAGSVYFLF
jgi:hypothetical protein